MARLSDYETGRIEMIRKKSAEFYRLPTIKKILKANEYAQGICLVATLLLDNRRKRQGTDMIQRLDAWNDNK